MTDAPTSGAAAREADPPVLVAVAWPYANGPLHLGHVAGSLLPPDVFARYQRLRGRRVIMVSGSDMHGTPITVAAEKEGVTPEALAERYNRLHKDALRALDIHFDLFTSTATETHRRVVHEIFLGLLRNGYIAKRTMTAPYDPRAERFLPDRYVEGECPNCHFPDARGDQCDDCGRTLDPQELLNPRSKFSGVAPEYRETDHYFLLLTKLEDALKAWVATRADDGNWRPTVRNFTENWLKEGLKDRAITRDLTYGVPIPAEVGDYPDKRIYVWFEAVVGYLSAAVEWAERAGEPDAWKPFWLASEDPRQYYFLGKDNIPFHTIIWPGMLLGYDEEPGSLGRLAQAWDVPANEFLQFAGAKFSKSRGNAFYVLDLLEHFDADAARYYLTINMPERGDTDWTWPDFVAKVNDELVATFGNYVNRVLAFCSKNYGGAPLGSVEGEEAEASLAFGRSAEASLADVARFLEARDFKKALRALVALSQKGNKAIDELAPWALVKQGEAGKAAAGRALLTHLAVIKSMAVALVPFLPTTADAIWKQLGEGGASPRALSEAMHPGEDAWPRSLLVVPPGQPFGDVKPLVKKLDLKAVLEEFAPDKPEETKVPDDLPAPQPGAPAIQNESQPAAETFKPIVKYDDFAKLDLRVGVVKSVEDHPKADKLYVLKVDLGTEERQILAGLRNLVPKEDLLGKHVVVVANLAPRQIRGLESQGMLLAAEKDGVVTPLRPSKDISPGATVL